MDLPWAVCFRLLLKLFCDLCCRKAFFHLWVLMWQHHCASSKFLRIMLARPATRRRWHGLHRAQGGAMVQASSAGGQPYLPDPPGSSAHQAFFSAAVVLLSSSACLGMPLGVISGAAALCMG